MDTTLQSIGNPFVPQLAMLYLRIEKREGEPSVGLVVSCTLNVLVIPG